MLITWLFGNGLDLSFGLKTSYYDFYEYLKQNENEIQNNLIYKQLRNDIDNHKLDLWNDYELRLGEITECISEDAITKFRDDKIEVDILLNRYLLEAEKALNIDENKVGKILSKSFAETGKCERETDKEIVKIILDQNANSSFHFKAISFNYTKTVALLWKEKNDEIRKLKINECPKSSYSCVLEQPFYVHGTLEDAKMIVGVNDSSQIRNEVFKNCDSSDNMLTKSNLQKLAGQQNRENYQNIINKSSLICIYGLSIGETDKFYWEVIKHRLINSNAILIIYCYKKGYKRQHVGLDNIVREGVKKHFYENSNTNDKEKEKIENKIIIEINHVLFDDVD